jgi:hypothetical protein
VGKLKEIANIDDALRGAALKAQDDKEQERKNYWVYNIPMEWVKAIKKKGVGVSTFAKIAIHEKLSRDGGL